MRPLGLVGGAALLAACAATAGPPAPRATAAPPGDSAGLVHEATSDPLAGTVAAPIVIFVEASAAEIEAARVRIGETDFPVVADDMMWYRSSAIDYMEAHAIPFVRITGRRPIDFRVAGKPTRFDFADVELLDFIVVYETDEQPRIVATSEVERILQEAQP